jgi:hypothetical protein
VNSELISPHIGNLGGQVHKEFYDLTVASVVPAVLNPEAGGLFVV